MDFFINLELEKLTNDKDKLELLKTYCLDLEAKLRSLDKKAFIDVFDEERRLKDIYCQLPGILLENNLLSNFIKKYDVPNYFNGPCTTFTYNKFFTCYFDRFHTEERGFFDIIELKLRKRKVQIWTDEEQVNGWAMSMCVNFLLKEKLLINDLNLKINADNFLKIRSDIRKIKEG
jgi:hypothetical protein